MLKNVAQRLKESVRSVDTVSRMGGDEFITVLEEVNDIHEINMISRRILDALVVAHKLEDLDVYATPSIGISIFPDDGDTCDTLIRHADTAMYKSKASGKSKISYFNSTTQKLIDGLQD